MTMLPAGSSRPVPRRTPLHRTSCGPPPHRGAMERIGNLPLAELEAAARLGAAVFLALDDARVAGQEAFALDGRTKRGLVAGQSGRDAVADSARLARQAAALDRRLDVILALAIGHVEHLVDDQAKRRTREIGFLLAAVDHDLARARLEPDARDGVLAAAG